MHGWTYAAGYSDDLDNKVSNCPCATTPGPNPPAVVVNRYYYESGNVHEISREC